MLIIRFSRVGKKNHAQYRIVLAEKSSPVKGKFVETLGSYDPNQKQAVLKEERIKYWLGNGAQCSDSVYNLLVSNKIIEGEKRAVKIPEKKEEENGEEATNEGDDASVENKGDEVVEESAPTEAAADKEKKEESTEKEKTEEVEEKNPEEPKEESDAKEESTKEDEKTEEKEDTKEKK